ncbi:FG-GAP-like repeat-containing protein [Hydrocarboniphaga sp.]|nr:FG-GAP-like repeat-containing protein [Hydrocarboniphaga sp.]MDZ4077077.1 FG-GAP-like repeat-containing protein [Hydrocarboniphaga sp.]
MVKAVASVKRARVLIFALLSFIWFWTNPANADVPPQYQNGLHDAGYEVYSGDYNGDGYPDLLLRAKHQFVLVDYEVPFPVLLRWRQSFMVLSNPDGTYSIVLSPSAAVLSSSVWQPDTHDLIFGDTDGDGSLELLLRSHAANGVNVIITTSPTDGTPQLRQRVNAADIGIDMGGAGLDADLLDTNGDGRADLLVGTRYGLVLQISEASSSGAFAPAPSNGGSGPTQGTEVGSTAGAFEVTPSGSASYTIPITIPPGLGGIEPKLAISFDSQGGDGLLGPRFAISGLSIISRCPGTPSQDGAYSPVAFSSSDRYCLDGARLVAVPSNTGHFRTELDSLSDIEKFGSSADNPDRWRVRNKAGLIMEFGGAVTSCGTSTSKILHPSYSNKTATWLLSKVSDTAGNWMEVCYDYDSSNGESWPRVINYTGNSLGDSPFASVKFVPKARIGVQQVAYSKGWKTTRTRVIDRIETSFEGRRIRTYKLFYTAYGTAQRDTLTAVQECGGEASYEKCLPATSFAWNAAPEGFSPTSTVNYAAINTDYQHFTGDLDADGKTDIVSAKMQSSGQLKAAVLLSTSANASAVFTVGAEVNVPPTNSNLAGASLAAGDFNGDGRLDIAAVKVTSSAQYVEMYTGNSSATTPFSGMQLQSITTNRFSKTPFQIFSANVNGDSRDDLLLVYLSQTEGIYIQALTGNASSFSALPVARPVTSLDSAYYRASVGDFNGDGFSDVAVHRLLASALTITVYAGNGAGSFTSLGVKNLAVSANHLQAADFNADGVTDLVLVKNGRTTCVDSKCLEVITTSDVIYPVICDGQGGFTISPGYVSDFVSATATNPLVIGDFNSDGITDAISWVSYSSSFLMLTGKPNGTFAESTIQVGTSTGTDRSVLSGDFDGDGKADVATYLTNSSTRRVELATAQQGLPSWLSSITSGIGARIELSYAPLTDSSVYSHPGQVCGGTVTRVLCGPISVVSASRISAGSSMREVKYTYDTAYADIGGRGFQSFAKTRNIDQTTGIVEESTFLTSWPLSGLLQKKTVLPSASSSSKVSETTVEYEARATVSGTTTPAVQTVQPIYTTTQNWEAGAFANSTAHVTTVDKSIYGSSTPFYQDATTVAHYTCAGNQTRTACEAAPDFSTVTVNEYKPADTTNWILGRLKTSTVTHGGAGLASIARSSSFDYDLATGLLKEETVEPNAPADKPYLKSLTTHVRDSTGNIYQETVQANALASVIATAPTLQSRSVNYIFDAGTPNYRRFKNMSCRGLGQTECSSSSYDGSTGQPISVSDANGLTKTYGYDIFGRAKIESFEDPGTGIQQAKLITRRWCQNNCAVSSAVYAIETTDNTGGFSAIQYDRDEREVARLAKAADGQIYKSLTIYDSAGRIYAKSLPFVGTAPNCAVAGTSGCTQYTYDVLGRVTIETNPAGKTRKVEYKGLTTVSYDELNRATTQLNNLLGKPVTVTDAIGGKIDYGYDATGNLTSTLDAGTDGTNGRATTTLEYDLRGRKTKQIDPSSGTWQYAYDGFGQLFRQEDAKGQVVRMSYDDLGRMVLRKEPEFLTQWRYDNNDTGQSWKGALFWVEQRVDSNGNGVFEPSDSFVYNRIYTYNSAGLPQTQTESLAGRGTYGYAYSYDGAGRLKQLTYPSGFRIQNRYNINGALDQVSRLNSDGSEGTAYWRADSWDKWGKTLNAVYGNGLTTIYTRDPQLGRLTDISTGTGSVQKLHYDWNDAGSLTGRQDSRTSLNGHNQSETFKYDNLGRLRTVTLGITGVLSPTQIQAATYYNNGNLNTKTGTDGIGTIAYDPAHPQWLSTSTTSGKAYIHDGNGNLKTITTNGATTSSYTWASYNLPTQLSRSGKTVNFTYGPDRQKLTQTIALSGKTIVYAGDLYEDNITGSNHEKKHYIPTPDGVVAIYTETGSSTKTEYLHKDHLGSVDVVTNTSGQVLEQLSYDAFGKRRSSSWQNALNPTPTNFLSVKGFTGHEMLDEVGLIHMNGRVYDPLIGRFISADPTLTNPLSTQGYNRYAYTENQFLNATDPSGYSWLGKKLKKIGNWIDDNWRTLAAVAIAIAAPYTISYFGLQGVAAYATAAAFGFAGGMVASGGDLRAGLLGAVSAAAFYGIGQSPIGKNASWGKWGTLMAKGLAHGAVGGISTEIQGGNFAKGFLSTGTAAFLAPGIDLAADGNFAIGVIASAIVGGTVSEIGGGKFSNGAITSAFSYALNQAVHDKITNQEVKNIINEADRILKVLDSDGIEGMLREFPHLGGLSPEDQQLTLMSLSIDIATYKVEAAALLSARIAYDNHGIASLAGAKLYQILTKPFSVLFNLSSTQRYLSPEASRSVGFACGNRSCDLYLGGDKVDITSLRN